MRIDLSKSDFKPLIKAIDIFINTNIQLNG